MDKQAGVLKEVKSLTAVENLLKILMTGIEAETTLQQALDYLISKFAAADMGIVWRYEPLTDTLIVGASLGIDIKSLQQNRFNPGAGIIGRAFRSGKSESFKIDNTIAADPNNIEKVLGVKIPGLASPVEGICIPLNANSTKYGALLFLRSGHSTSFTSKDTLFFQISAYLLTIHVKMDAMSKIIKEIAIASNNEQYKAGIVSNLAHEMRTPLTSIKGFSTALLMKDVVYSPEKQKEFLEIIDRECDILEDLIADHLESSIIEAGMMKVDLQPVRLPRLAKKAADDIGRRFPKHVLLVDFTDDFPLVDADPERILQVLRQLLDNAAKYSPEGGLIVLQGKIVENKAVISLADEGVGIAPEDLNHLFDRFFRAKSNSGSQIIGTGLGLPICRAIVEAHGGHIWAESQPGQGSKFYFSLPLKGPSQGLAD
ncbi:MAG: GAF domain-containing protein [Dehalococcoidia bacterium]|nr:GAF domain-containing protein [Dehalococcoidia bacterium]